MLKFLRSLPALTEASPAAVFKVFTAIVLVQFSILSFIGIAAPGSMAVLSICDTAVHSASFWWGIFSLFGAMSLAFEPLIRGCLGARITGYCTALSSFVLLSIEFALHKPPVYAGLVFSVTSSLFLGGLLYGLLRQR